jgi:EcsC protein family
MKKPTPADAARHEDKGKKLLSAVERILASDAALKARVAEATARAKSAGKGSKDEIAQVLVKRASDYAALVGGAASIPALFPGVGSLAVGLGGLLTELSVLLKLEVELALCLQHLYGYDIAQPRERQLAFVMASVGTYDATGGNFFADLARTEGQALWNYGPRQLSKFLLVSSTAIALVWLWRGFAKLIPVIGIAVGSGMNKLLTGRVGKRMARDLGTRAQMQGEAEPKAKKPKKKHKAKATAKAKRATPPAEDGVAH